jgi:hypothetical protein
MLAKAGESDRAIRVKMVRPPFFFFLVFSFRLFGLFCSLVIGTAGRVPGWSDWTRCWKFSNFSFCPPSQRQIRPLIYLSLSAQTSLLWETEGRQDQSAIRTRLVPQGIHSMLRPFCTCTFLHIISWHTTCTLHVYHHTRALLLKQSKGGYVHPRSLDKVKGICACNVYNSIAAAIGISAHPCIRNRTINKKKTNINHKNRAEGTERNKE